MNRTLEVQLTCVAKQVREKVICHSWWAQGGKNIQMMIMMINLVLITVFTSRP